MIINPLEENIYEVYEMERHEITVVLAEQIAQGTRWLTGEHLKVVWAESGNPY
jgi:hypothetical protein